jgi:hypothetical protein
MKRFDFPLERVRRWRREQASLEELKLQQLLAQKAALFAARCQIDRERADEEQQLFARPFLAGSELEALDSYSAYSRGRVRHLEDRERQCESQIVEQRNRLLEARRRFELLDKLHQQSLKTWQAALNKEYEDLAAESFLAASRRGI